MDLWGRDERGAESLSPDAAQHLSTAQASTWSLSR